MKQLLLKPRILEYQNILEFLKDTYKYRKQTTVGFSYEKWAGEIGLRSRSYLRALVLGHKPLQESVLPLLLKGFQFNDKELHYFTLLFRLQITPPSELRNVYMREVFSAWKTKIQEVEVTNTVEFLSDPLIATLFTYLSLSTTTSDLMVIAKDLACEPGDIQKALQHLIWSKLVDGVLEEDGSVSYRTIVPFFKIPSLPGNQHIKAFHIEGIRQSQAAVSLSPEVRKMFSSFFVLDRDQLKLVQGLIEDFNQNLLSIVSTPASANNPGTEKRIYRLNQQLFPVSESITETYSDPQAEDEKSL